jgi:hypothetical protein
MIDEVLSRMAEVHTRALMGAILCGTSNRWTAQEATQLAEVIMDYARKARELNVEEVATAAPAPCTHGTPESIAEAELRVAIEIIKSLSHEVEVICRRRADDFPQYPASKACPELLRRAAEFVRNVEAHNPKEPK